MTANLTSVVKLNPPPLIKLGLVVIYPCRSQRKSAPKLEKSQPSLGTRGLVKSKVPGPFRWVHPLIIGLFGQFYLNIPVYPLTVLLVVLLTARLRILTLPQVPIPITREPLLSIRR